MGMERIHISKTDLENFYLRQRLPANRIAQVYECTDVTVFNKMQRYGIPSRTTSEAMRLDRWVNIQKDKLRDYYFSQKLSVHKLAKIYNCSPKTISNRLKHYGFKARPFGRTFVIHHKYPKKDFSGNLIEKAYLIGFRLGDLYIYKPNKGGETVMATCGSAKSCQIKLIKNLFKDYGHIWIGKPDLKRNGWRKIECSLNPSFNFLLKKEDKIERWILRNKKYFLAFLAGYIDAEGSFGVYYDRPQFHIATNDKNILVQIHQKLEKLGISCPKVRVKKFLYGDKMVTNHRELKTYRIKSLLKLYSLVYSHLKHEKRKRDSKKVKSSAEKLFASGRYKP